MLPVCLVIILVSLVTSEFLQINSADNVVPSSINSTVNLSDCKFFVFLNKSLKSLQGKVNSKLNNMADISGLIYSRPIKLISYLLRVLLSSLYTMKLQNFSDLFF